MYIEDDVLVVLCAANTGESRMRLVSTMVLEAAKTGLEISCVGEGQGFWYLDD